MSPRRRTVHASVALAAPAEHVWSFITGFVGINDELRPLLRMTIPPRLRATAAIDVEPPVALGPSLLLLFGVLPVDVDDIRLVAFDPPRRFLERSRLRSARHWEHERVIEDTAGGCRLTDRVTFEPRWSATGPILRTAVARLFRHRHARLAARFGAA
ncbi:Ligand-binding SRPBCC domain-containing protein [Amycolatopsis arida]|uniref:Ligand-binding SRPBCC domain-containing protein n=1 Tax=Amycolatopsis arida TaxID=587909 RepID=A0A1I5WE29_9PSEU|nr:hypothetical protein [Amycolatopsis arida]TDX92232.1 ligand-binding SRPBCC domain-containing protein [Amycolatopsis arida]SFQ17867.1 Ligand-binding SRPBCC domain-containing protein [Amycolatopsis arida]